MRKRNKSSECKQPVVQPARVSGDIALPKTLPGKSHFFSHIPLGELSVYRSISLCPFSKNDLTNLHNHLTVMQPIACCSDNQ